MVKNSDNIKKLQELVVTLEHSDTKDYRSTLHKIETLIKEEIDLISQLTKSDNKLKHYENICTGILTMISSSNL